MAVKLSQEERAGQIAEIIARHGSSGGYTYGVEYYVRAIGVLLEEIDYLNAELSKCILREVRDKEMDAHEWGWVEFGAYSVRIRIRATRARTDGNPRFDLILDQNARKQLSRLIKAYKEEGSVPFVFIPDSEEEGPDG